MAFAESLSAQQSAKTTIAYLDQIANSAIAANSEGNVSYSCSFRLVADCVQCTTNGITSKLSDFSASHPYAVIAVIAYAELDDASTLINRLLQPIQPLAILARLGELLLKRG